MTRRTIERIPLKGLFNTRDLGGFEVNGGHTVKPRRLIRSGQLFYMAPEDMEMLAGNYELKNIIDFRTEDEQREKPDPQIPGINYISNPILKEMAAGITHDQESDKRLTLEEATLTMRERGFDPHNYMKAMYQDIITSEYSLNQYRRFFGILSDQEAGSTLWHCSAGKDRVGIATAMLLYVLGADPDRILEDYMMTRVFLKEEIEKMIKALSSRIKDSATIDCIRICMGVEKEYLTGVFDTMKKTSGSISGFLNDQIGLTSSRVEKLKTLYLA